MRRQRQVLHPAGTFPLWSCWTRILNRETYLEVAMRVVVGNSALSTFPRYGIRICSCDLLAVASIFVRLKAGNDFAWLYLFFCFCNLRGNLIRWNFHRLRHARNTSSSSLFLRMYLGAWDNKQSNWRPCLGRYICTRLDSPQFFVSTIFISLSCPISDASFQIPEVLMNLIFSPKVFINLLCHFVHLFRHVFQNVFRDHVLLHDQWTVRTSISNSHNGPSHRNFLISYYDPPRTLRHLNDPPLHRQIKLRNAQWSMQGICLLQHSFASRGCHKECYKQ